MRLFPAKFVYMSFDLKSQIGDLFTNSISLTILTVPQNSIKAEIIEAINSLKETKTGQIINKLSQKENKIQNSIKNNVFVFDFRELSEISIISLYQYILTVLLENKSNRYSEIRQFNSNLDEIYDIKNTTFLFHKIKEIFNANDNYTLVFYNTHLIYQLYESFFTNLEVISEDYNNIKFIFHFEQNILTERIKRQLNNNFLPYNQIVYYPVRNDFIPKNQKMFFYQLAENEQLILRLIFTKSKILNAEYTENIKYLVNTGVISNSLKINLSFIEKILLNENDVIHQEYKIISNNVYYGEIYISNKITDTQAILLEYFVNNSDRLILRDQVGEKLWGQKWYEMNDWSLDKTISRLKKKLKIITGHDPIQTIKKKGYYFVSNPKELIDNIRSKQSLTKTNDNRTSNKTDDERFYKWKDKNIKYTKLKLDKETLNYHYDIFNNQERRQYLFSATPKDKQEIYLWLKNSLENPVYLYYKVIYKNRFVGHIGLKEIDTKTKTAVIGYLSSSDEITDSTGQDVLDFISHEAKKLGLQIISCQPNKNHRSFLTAMKNAGFTPLPGDESKLVKELG